MNEFELMHDRKDTKSLKWDKYDHDILPMWVADMDFQAPEEVNQALIERAQHGIYGYTYIDSHVEDAIQTWIDKHHNWKIKKEWIGYSPSVVTSLHIAVQALTEKHDKILIQTPVYNPFYNVIEDHQRTVVKNPLIKKDGAYQIDFIDLEEKLQQDVKAFILCSPHNPVGRVWTKEELTEISRLCLKYNVLVLSDEIHCDLVFSEHKHLPIASLSNEVAKQTITFMSASKTFNLAGLQASYFITKNRDLHEKITKHLDIQGLNALNTMGITALEAAYTYGDKWLKQLRHILVKHKQYVIDMFAEHAPELSVIEPEATYLLWINCEKLGMNEEELEQFMIHEAKVGLNAGSNYGVEGNQYMRMNIACHTDSLKEGVNRIIQAINKR